MSAFAPEKIRTPLFSSPKTLLKFAALLIACSLPFIPSGERDLDELVREDQLYLDPGTMTPFTGVAVATYAGESSRIAQHLGISGARYDGPFDRLIEDRRLSSTETYVDGVRMARTSGTSKAVPSSKKARTPRAYWKDLTVPSGSPVTSMKRVPTEEASSTAPDAGS